jgi:hypothetical protein
MVRDTSGYTGLAFGNVAIVESEGKAMETETIVWVYYTLTFQPFLRIFAKKNPKLPARGSKKKRDLKTLLMRQVDFLGIMIQGRIH